MEVQGRIKVLGETKEYGNKGFKKRELVLTTEEQYPQVLPIEFVQDKTSLLDKFAIGQQVKVSINLRGREWTSPQGEVKYYSSIQGWRIEALQANDAPQEMPPIPPADAFEPATKVKEEDFDDLPF